MKFDKVNIEILKAVLKNPGRVAYYETPDGSICVLPAGPVCYVLPCTSLRVNLDGAQQFMVLEQLYDEAADASFHTPLKPTDEYRAGGVAQKYLYDGQPDKPIYINTKLLANFDCPTLHQLGSYTPTGYVTVVKYPYDVDTPVLSGWVAPMKVEE